MKDDVKKLLAEHVAVFGEQFFHFFFHMPPSDRRFSLSFLNASLFFHVTSTYGIPSVSATSRTL